MAGKNLVIVESPTKAKTITRMLDKNYTVLASMGHIRDLPERSLGVDIKNGFAPVYEESKRGAKIIRELKKAAKAADNIYLAPDPDREGEAIAWHLQEILKKSYKGEFHRVTFHEITKSAIARAFETPGTLDTELVDAQQARRVLDRLVGYQVSPLLWSRIKKGVSAGRVQSVALRLVCEREREIQAFVPEEYWNFAAKFLADDKLNYEGRLAMIDRAKFVIDNEKDAGQALNAIRDGGDPRVDAIRQTPKKRNAMPPFTTSTLQQAANNQLRLSASNTMRLAQQLYEGIDLGSGQAGLITYMRTDSVSIAMEAKNAIRGFVAANYGNEYIPPKPNFFKNKSGAQAAHEAIRPTDVTLTPGIASKYLDNAQLKLYTLIWKRSVASQMAQCRQAQTSVDTVISGADNREYLFRSTALVTTFPGFMLVYGKPQEEDNEAAEVLGQLREKMLCQLLDSLNEQKFTEPPPRFSEATLIKELEANGIGRPSTYATILRTIQSREYVEREKGRLHPTELGFSVNDFLVSHLNHLFETGFTSQMETKLDMIEEGKLNWTTMLEEFYHQFGTWLEEAKHHNAPPEEKVANLIKVFEGFSDWNEPEKSGRRTYDDNKFFTSVKESFAKNGKITARQWESLMMLGAKYYAKLNNISDIAIENGFENDLAAAVVKQQELAKKIKKSTASSDDTEKYKKIFAAFNNLEWDEPTKSRGRTYDDKKFFNSLKKQAESGKVLSEKQLGVINRFAIKYKDKIENFTELCALLEVDPNAAEAAAAPPAPEVVEQLEILSKVTKWAEPTKKGKRVFDDKAFYESLDSQARSGRTLSPRQLGALKRIVTKYSK
ncbi:MAG: type I DNA topoisomerase [Victivallaceae bacterium]|nr:type I DNA topoisomerase [Victivallaceae bacterium]